VSEPVVTDIQQFEAPFGRKVLLQDVAHESGLKLMRIRIREGTRFTILDIDAATAREWSEAMREWAAANAADGGGDSDRGE